MTRLTNTLNLPKVSGYILAGILIGFVSDLALTFIAFGVGKFFKKEVIIPNGNRTWNQVQTTSQHG